MLPFDAEKNRLKLLKSYPSITSFGRFAYGPFTSQMFTSKLFILKLFFCKQFTNELSQK